MTDSNVEDMSSLVAAVVLLWLKLWAELVDSYFFE
jgi:hypothetical protein